ncbi:DUF6778 family protein [Sulfitobacter sp.]|uniref:DUF6778 family protein n=1 Tax=Sulfitobacter sp. TaxID=1903071 RepID=UPI003299D933
MKMIKFACALSIGAFLSACGVSDVVTRSVPFQSQETRIVQGTRIHDNIALNLREDTSVRRVTDSTQAARTILPEAILRQINVAKINVSVPTSLKVSEANRYYPPGDIVWRGDAIGNRHEQVARIVYDAMTTGTASFQGPNPVILDIQLVRFHSLSEKARYTVGGVHHVVFNMAVRDATTGQFLSEPRRVDTDLAAFGGQQAKTAEANGLTQKVRISGHLGEVIRQQLMRPETYSKATPAFYQRVSAL